MCVRSHTSFIIIISASFLFFSFARPRLPQKGKNSPPLPRPKPLKKKKERKGATPHPGGQGYTPGSGSLLVGTGLSGAGRFLLFFPLSGGANKAKGDSNAVYLCLMISLASRRRNHLSQLSGYSQ